MQNVEAPNKHGRAPGSAHKPLPLSLINPRLRERCRLQKLFPRWPLLSLFAALTPTGTAGTPGTSRHFLPTPFWVSCYLWLSRRGCILRADSICPTHCCGVCVGFPLLWNQWTGNHKYSPSGCLSTAAPEAHHPRLDFCLPFLLPGPLLAQTLSCGVCGRNLPPSLLSHCGDSHDELSAAALGVPLVMRSQVTQDV